MIRRVLLLALFGGVASQAGALTGANQFQSSFNSVAAKHGVPLRSGPAKCDGSICEYALSPRGRISVVYGGSAKRIDELAAYFSPDAEGGSDAIAAVNVLIRIMGASVAEPLRRAAVDELLASATGARRDGEVTIGKWRYVVRPSDGRDIRLYVTSTE